MRKLLHAILVLAVLATGIDRSFSQTVDIPLLPGVWGYGNSSKITVLSNGNFVYSNRNYGSSGQLDRGIVQLYNGKTLALITTITGSRAGDRVGDRVYALPNGNFVTSSQYYDSNVPDVGGVWWMNGVTGATTLLKGSSYMDQVGLGAITILPNSNYLVNSYRWTNGTGKSLGAVTWCNGATGRSGDVSVANSFVGATDDDLVGTTNYVVALSNGNYVVATPNWDNGALMDVGAVTFGNGTTGTFGAVSASNSLIGTSAGDRVGSGGVAPLTNGNYVVCSPVWWNGAIESAGAATWANGTTGLIGAVTTANSLVGSKIYDRVGNYGVTALTNGNYVVRSGFWMNGALSLAGAATWGDGTTGITGVVSAANSLVGGIANSFVGLQNVEALTNGNYVVSSSGWSSATKNGVGAITWADGAVGIKGEVSETNSLVGKNANEKVSKVTGLTNGNYVVASPGWSNDNGETVGAVVWADGSKGIIGTIDASNAITGLKNGDAIANSGLLALSDGNYIIASRSWDSQTVADAGAVTWMDGSKPATGQVTEANSLYGNISGGLMSLDNPVVLKKGSYVFKTSALKVTDPDPGTITWSNGGQFGEINATNSLVGSHDQDEFGFSEIGATEDGQYFVLNSRRSAEQIRAGSVTWGNGISGTSGTVNDCNSVIGMKFNGGSSMSAAYNEVYKYLIVGRGAEDLITIYYPSGGPFLAKPEDIGSANLGGGQATHLLNPGGCRILASLASTGSNPVTGLVDAKVWVENSIPRFGRDPFVARHYEITPANNAATATGRLTLYFSQKEFNDFNAAPGSDLNLPASAGDAPGKANLRIGKYSGTSNDGTGLPGTYPSAASTIIDPADTDIIWNDTFRRWEVTFDTEGFSGFVIQTSPVPLPVRLVAFSAKPEGKTVKLDWKIADAVNFSHFEIEHTPDAKQFEFFGKVDFEEDVENYTITDNEPRAGANGQAYYRLKMVDQDGSYAYSKIAAAQFDGNHVGYVYPNPVADYFKISLSGYDGKTGTMRLVNASGKVLRSEAFTVKNGEIRMDLKKPRLEEGHYIIQLDLGGERRQFKIVRTR